MAAAAGGSLVVQGFSGHLLALNGTYHPNGENHGKSTYTKHAEIDNTSSCCIYYWDDRDGEPLAGWWMAPEVGGEQVWAHAPIRSEKAPPRGWKVPWHAPSPDPKVVLEHKPATGKGSGTSTGVSALQPVNKNARSAFNQATKPMLGSVADYSGTGQSLASIQNMAQLKRFPVGSPMTADSKAARSRALLVQVNGAVTAVEIAVAKLTGPLSKEPNFDLNRHISMAKSTINTALRCMDAHVKAGALDDSMVMSQKTKVQSFERNVQKVEDGFKVEQKKKLETLKTTFFTDLTALVTKAEEKVEKTKDVAVVFTCDMADHIKPEDAFEAKEKTDAESIPAAEALKAAKDLLFQKDKEIRGYPHADVQAIRESIKPLNIRLSEVEKELAAVKSQAMNAVRRAQGMIAKKKREDEMERLRKERERVAEWNKALLGDSLTLGLIADEVLRQCMDENMEAGEDQLRTSEARALGLRAELQKKQENKDCQPHSRANLMIYFRKIDTVIGKIRELLKEQTSKGKDKTRRMTILVAVATRRMQGTKTDAAFFEQINKGEEKMDQAMFLNFINDLGAAGSSKGAKSLFKDACLYSGGSKKYLTKDSFFMTIAHAYYYVTQPTPLQKKESLSSETLCFLEQDTVVNLIDGPVEVEGSVRVKCVQTLKDGSYIEGWASLRLNAIDLLQRYSPYYTLLSDTVLTESFSLKDFKVVARLKNGEKFTAVGVPKYNPESEMWRVEGFSEKKTHGWVTIKGNKGTALLKNEPVVHPEKEVEPESLSEEKLNGILKAMAALQIIPMRSSVEEVDAATKEVFSKLSELEELDKEDGQVEHTQEETQETINAVDAAFATHKQIHEKSASTVNGQISMLRHVETGPYADLKNILSSFLEKLAESETTVNAAMEKKARLQASVTSREEQRRLAKEKEEQEELSKRLHLEMKPRFHAVEELSRKLHSMEEERTLPSLVQSIKDFSSNLESLKTDLESLKQGCEDVKTWVQENLVKAQPEGKSTVPSLTSLAQEMIQLQNRAEEVLKLRNAWTNTVKAYSESFKEKLRVEFSLRLKARLEKKKQTIDALFVEISKGKETVSLAEFKKFGKTICPGIEDYESFLKITCGTRDVSKDHLKVLSAANYRCLKRTLLTDVRDISQCKRLRRVEPDEIVEVIEGYEKCEATGLTRFKARDSDGLEGYVSIRGNKHTTYLELQQNGYRVVKETVFTDRFEMEGYKVLRRFKVGDFVRSLSHPEYETSCSLWRMRAQAMDGTYNIGWITLKKNQGPTFLVNCELPDEKNE